VDLSQLEMVVKQAFGQRRKTIKNNFKPLMSEEEIVNLKIDPKCRPETIKVDQYVAITNYLSNKTNREDA
jgi:16S rRNA (adenine1518-N6/adenine1519-N6)-dimethyltransferase